MNQVIATLSAAASEGELYRPFDDIGQPCGGYECDGVHYVCSDCLQSYRDWYESMRPYGSY